MLLVLGMPTLHILAATRMTSWRRNSLLKSMCIIFITTILYLCLRLQCLGVVRIVARTRIVDVLRTCLTHYFWWCDLLEEHKHKLQFKGPTNKGPNKGHLVRCRHRKSILREIVSKWKAQIAIIGSHKVGRSLLLVIYQLYPIKCVVSYENLKNNCDSLTTCKQHHSH